MPTAVRSVLSVVVAVSLWGACVRTAPPPAPQAPPEPPVRIPAGCERDLGGSYVHAANPSFRYEARDDGKTLTLEVLRSEAGDRSPGSAAGAGTQQSGERIVLTRTPFGFRGTTRGTAYPPGGKSCPVDFPTELTGCADDALLLLSAEEVSVHSQTCEPAPSAPRPAMVEQRLVRVESPAAPSAIPPAADAGTVSAPLDGGGEPSRR